jgi:hypothetical protein
LENYMTQLSKESPLSVDANALTSASTEVSIQPVSPAISQAVASTFTFEHAERLDITSFPHQQRNGKSQLPGTIPNWKHLLDYHGITVCYNAISKKLDIKIPGHVGSPDNLDNIAYAQIFSLAALNGMSTTSIPSALEAIGDRNQFNPVAAWFNSKTWDGTDRLEEFYATLIQREDYPIALKKILMRRWLIGAVAAVLMPNGFKARGVLTLQGPQSIGKTSWISELVSNPILRDSVVKLDHHLDAGNKDSLITAITHWIVEIGELDSSFKKDIARLKGFLTAGSDKLRRPYGRTNSEYQRRTVFCATVNDENFLVDSTGNTRWWTIPVTSINFNHGIDMQQVFAQVATLFTAGEAWWLTKEEEALLESQNANHRTISSIHERILGVLDLARVNESGLAAMTATELLQEVDIKHPSQAQFKECHAVLRELLGVPKKINGSMKWRIPMKKAETWSPYTKSIQRSADDF